MKTPSTSLIHILIGKSILETIFVGALAVLTFINILPPYFHGWSEVTNTGISGWVVNDAAPWDRVEVQLFVDGKFVASGVANESRPDVMAAGWSKESRCNWLVIRSVSQLTPIEEFPALDHDDRKNR